MANNVLGYFGIENYEIILYLARILNKLGRKILLIDYSFTDNLTVCIPIPVGLNAFDDVVTYFGVDFTRKELDADLINVYDDILINFGFNYNINAAQSCTRIVYSTDLQKHNIEKLISIPNIEKAEKSLLIKDAVDSKVNQAYILDRLQKDINKEKVYVFDQDVIDTKYKILAQYDTLFEFRKITRAVKDYLKNTIRELCPCTTEKERKEAYKIAERGR